jgi:hypothetical protein
MQTFSQERRLYVNEDWIQVQGSCGLPKPQWHGEEFQESNIDVPQSLGSPGHAKLSPRDVEKCNQKTHTSRTRSRALCQKFEDLMVDNRDVTSNPLSAEQIPRRSVLNKSHKVTAGPTPEDTAIALTCQPHKPSEPQAPQWSSPQQRPPDSKNGRSAAVTGTLPRHSPLPVVDSSHLHQGQCQP